jgi:hypothetical protein
MIRSSQSVMAEIELKGQGCNMLSQKVLLSFSIFFDHETSVFAACCTRIQHFFGTFASKRVRKEAAMVSEYGRMRKSLKHLDLPEKEHTYNK